MLVSFVGSSPRGRSSSVLVSIQNGGRGATRTLISACTCLRIPSWWVCSAATGPRNREAGDRVSRSYFAVAARRAD